MKFDQPASTNPIDQLKVIGKPTNRIEGPLKTTGTAKYAYEHTDMRPAPAYGYTIGSAIAKGRLASIDLSKANASPGVITIVTAETAGKLDKGPRNTAKLFAGPDIEHYHQAIAVVVADTFEQARAAAALVKVEYVVKDGAFDLSQEKEKARPPKPDPQSGPSDSSVGEFEMAFKAAPIRLDETYTTPDQSHSMMEPHASIARWDGDKLTIWTSNQMIAWGVADLATTLGIPKEDIRLISPFIGGGFGAKLFLRSDIVVAALAARAAGRPVKVTLQRPLIPNNTTHRPATIQRIRLGATQDGKLTAIAHESWSGDLPDGSPETAVMQTRMLYAGANRMTSLRLATLDLPEGNAMRAPGEASGMMALEIAMDEMAEKLGMDPVEFRIRNDTQVVPDNPETKESASDKAVPAKSEKPTELPFSLRQLNECLKTGSDRFGWSKRNRKPGQVQDGPWHIGMGVAAAFRNNMLMKSAARVRLDRRGIATVETDMTDIGTGSYTIIAQTAAEMLGLPLENIVVKLGDSSFPASCGSGGQWGGNNSTAGVYAACMKLRETISQNLGINHDEAQFTDGTVRAGDRSIPLTMATASGDLVAEDMIEYGDLDKRMQQSTFGAHFVEVGVHKATAEIRVRRMLAICAAGRILNPKAARSQVIGAMTMGVGAALMEELVVDKRRGFFVNHDLAGYEVPVHADIPHQEVMFLDEVDAASSPMKAKGVAELGICGVAAAIANATYNATGVRVREYPITLDKLLGRFGDAA